VRPLRSVFLVTVLALALSAAGCGGSNSDVPEVPGPPTALTVPHQRGAADLAASPTPTPSTSATGTVTPTATTGTGTTTGTTGTTGGTGTNTAATQAPATQQDTATNNTAPAAGSAPQKFEQFCQENAGAC
jgi:hypothetical protein